MKKYLLIIPILFGVLSIALGQTEMNPEPKAINRIGFQAGFSMATNVYVSDVGALFNQGISNLPAFNAGFYTEQGKSEYFTTQIGLYYQKKGSKTDEGNIHLHYIHVPLMMSVRMPIAGPVFMKLGLGPYASYAFYGKMETPIGDFMDIFSMPKKEAIENKDLNPLDFGVSFGGQIEYILPDKRSIELAVKYDVGVWKASNETVDEDFGTYNPGLKNRVLSINLVYSFNLSKIE